MNKVTVRPATKDDAKHILGFINELAEYEKLTHQVVATVEELQATLFGERPFAEAIIGEVDGEISGYALFFHNYSTFLARPGLYVEDIYVTQKVRGKGLGKAFLGALARVAKERGCGRLEWAVLDWNQPAIDFYQSKGVEILPDWRVCRVMDAELDRLAAL